MSGLTIVGGLLVLVVVAFTALVVAAMNHGEKLEKNQAKTQ